MATGMRRAATWRISSPFRSLSPPVGRWAIGSSRWQASRVSSARVGVGRDREVEMLPFYQLHRHRYAAYWDLYTPESWKEKSAEIALQRERQSQLGSRHRRLCPAGRNAA